MATLPLRTAPWQHVTRTLSMLLASLTLLASSVLAQTAETACPPEPVFDENGQFDDAAYQIRLEQCLREELEKQLASRKQEQRSASRALSVVEATTAVLEQDSLALVALYNSTNGPNWTNNTNWLTGPVPTWFGITLSGGRVAEIRLRNNQLSGSITPQLGTSTSLHYLDLSDNQLTGSIPSELGNLSSLQFLLLGHNELTGGIPSELGRLSNLEFLSLSQNPLRGSIPPQLGNLKNLWLLSLTLNQLSGDIPAELGQLTSLRDLILDQNQLTGSIPPELGELANLRRLVLSWNQLTGEIPPELGKLINLESYLALHGNQLTGGIPPELGKLNKLQVLILEYNQLSGSIPEELSKLAKLRGLSIQQNPMSGPLPLSLSKLTQLETFYFQSTNLCVPQDPAFLAWLQGIDNVIGSGIACEALPPVADSDDDGVLDPDDRCPGTTIPEATVPSLRLGQNHFALINEDMIFDTVRPHGAATSFRTGDTGGCSCEQIIEAQGLGEGHVKYGCSIGVMKDWVDFVSDGSKQGAEAGQRAERLPEAFVLEGNYPNPFNPQTEIRFGLPEASEVRLVVYDVTGREVARLVEGPLAAGYHAAGWEASGMPSGVYLYRLTAGAYSQARTMVLLK